MRSSRLMPGLRGTPAVTMTDVGAGDVGVVFVSALRFTSLPKTAAASAMSRRLALGRALGDVEQDHVAELFTARRAWASVPPIMPAPIRAIFFRAHRAGPEGCAAGRGLRTDAGIRTRGALAEREQGGNAADDTGLGV